MNSAVWFYPCEEIKEFFNANKNRLRDECILVAEVAEEQIEVYITEERDMPHFSVEVCGVVEYEATTSSENEIETIYRQLLALYIREETCELDEEDEARISDIYSATSDYLSILLEGDTEDFFDGDTIDEIIYMIEELLYNNYGFSIRHPIADGDVVIQYPFSGEEI